MLLELHLAMSGREKSHLAYLGDARFQEALGSVLKGFLDVSRFPGARFSF